MPTKSTYQYSKDYDKLYDILSNNKDASIVIVSATECDSTFFRHRDLISYDSKKRFVDFCKDTDVKYIDPAEYKKIDGTTSDGYHTFDELYHHRTVLFAALCAAYPLRSWKSKKHSDGSMFEGMFICGINTPYGPATYHIDLKFWEMFDCHEIKNAPEWDGYTPDDVVNRIMSIN